MVIVYWIHRREHSDPSTEGYIGVSKNLDRRIQEHQREKWFCGDDSIVDVLKTFKEEVDAYLHEELLRPTANIGWNLNKGGTKPPTNDRVGVPLPSWSAEQKQTHSNRMKEYYTAGRIVHWSHFYTKEEVSLKISKGDPGKSHRGKPATNKTSIKEMTQNVVYRSQTEAARLLNIRQGDIANCLSGRQQSVKGYRFIYTNQE